MKDTPRYPQPHDLPDESQYEEPELPDGVVPQPEPPDGLQDPDAPLDEADDDRALAFLTALVAPRNAPEAIAWYAGQHEHPDKDYLALCLQFSRLGRGIPPQQPYAYAAWLAIDPDGKQVGGRPEDAPLGSFLFFKGPSSIFGHIMPKTRPFESHRAAAWSNDLVRAGKIDKVSVRGPIDRWGQSYLGHSWELHGYDMQVGKLTKPKPKDDKPYVMLERAAHNIGVSLDTARGEHDKDDVEKIRALLRRTERLAHKLKHS
jgi:hypothetical protein